MIVSYCDGGVCVSERGERYQMGPSRELARLVLRRHDTEGRTTPPGGYPPLALPLSVSSSGNSFTRPFTNQNTQEVKNECFFISTGQNNVHIFGERCL